MAYEIRLNYADLIALKILKNLPIQYVELDETYEIFITEVEPIWACTVVKTSPDGIDFTTNYKPTANQAIIPRTLAGIPEVSVNNFPVTQPISATSLPLPAGASTETTLAALNTKVTTTASGIKVDGSAVVQPVTVGNFPAVQVVSGLSAPGTVPALNPVSVAGVDGGGLKRPLLTDTAGATAVVGESINGATANPNPVIIGGRDDTGVITSANIDDVLHQNSLYTASAPIQADLVQDGSLFTAVVEVNLPNTTEIRFFLLKNPPASGKRIFINSILLDTTTKGALLTARLYANPVTTADGTAAPIVNLDIKTSPAASIATAFTNPTVTSNGTKIAFFSVGSNANSAYNDFHFGILLEPGNTLLVTGVGDANNRVIVLDLVWAEVLI